MGRTGHRQAYTQARRRHTESSHSALLIGAVPGWDVWRLPWGMAAFCSNTSGTHPSPALVCGLNVHRIVSLIRQRCCSSKKTTVVKKKILFLK